MKAPRFILAGLFALLLWGAAYADVPRTFSYQGVLTDANGTPLPNGSYNLTLRLYSVATGGSALWTEGQLVTLTSGVFSTELGSSTALSLPFDQPYFLSVSVNGGAEMTPRTALTSSAYSLNSASVADGAVTSSKIAANAVTRDKLAPGAVPKVEFGQSGNTTTIGATWTNYQGCNVPIYCPTTGYVVVQATAWLQLNHTQGTADIVQLCTDTSATTGNGGPYFYSTYEIPGPDPTATNIHVTLPVLRKLVVFQPGTYTFYLNGQMNSGASTGDIFWYANMVATFYPATLVAADFLPPPTIQKQP